MRDILQQEKLLTITKRDSINDIETRNKYKM